MPIDSRILFLEAKAEGQSAKAQAYLKQIDRLANDLEQTDRINASLKQWRMFILGVCRDIGLDPCTFANLADDEAFRLEAIAAWAKFVSQNRQLADYTKNKEQEIVALQKHVDLLSKDREQYHKMREELITYIYAKRQDHTQFANDTEFANWVLGRATHALATCSGVILCDHNRMDRLSHLLQQNCVQTTVAKDSLVSALADIGTGIECFPDDFKSLDAIKSWVTQKCADAILSAQRICQSPQ